MSRWNLETATGAVGRDSPRLGVGDGEEAVGKLPQEDDSVLVDVRLVGGHHPGKHQTRMPMAARLPLGARRQRHQTRTRQMAARLRHGAAARRRRIPMPMVVGRLRGIHHLAPPTPMLAVLQVETLGTPPHARPILTHRMGAAHPPQPALAARDGVRPTGTLMVVHLLRINPVVTPTATRTVPEDGVHPLQPSLRLLPAAVGEHRHLLHTVPRHLLRTARLPLLHMALRRRLRMAPLRLVRIHRLHMVPLLQHRWGRLHLELEDGLLLLLALVLLLGKIGENT